MPRKPGPPSPYSPKVRKHVLEMVAEGLSLGEAIDKLELPRRTVRSWLDRDPTFAHDYELARHERVDSLFEAFIRRALAATEVVAAAERDGLNANAQATALRVELDQMRWPLSKLLPGRFSDRVQVAGDAEAPLFVEQTDPGKLALGIMSILAKAKQAEASIIDNEPELPAVSLSAGLGAPAPLFAPGTPDPLWSRDAVAQPRAGTNLAARPAEPVADATQLVEPFAGAIAQTAGRPAQMTEGERRESERLRGRQHSAPLFDITTGRRIGHH